MSLFEVNLDLRQEEGGMTVGDPWCAWAVRLFDRTKMRPAVNSYPVHQKKRRAKCKKAKREGERACDRTRF